MINYKEERRIKNMDKLKSESQNRINEFGFMKREEEKKKEKEEIICED